MKITCASELNAVLLNDLTAGFTMQQVVDDIFEKSGMQIALLDLNNHLLMHAFNGSESRIWNFAFEKGHLPQSITAKESKTGERIAEIFRTGTSVLFDTGEIDDCCHICRPIYADGRPEGMLVVRFYDRRAEALAEEIAERLTALNDYFIPPKAPIKRFEGDFLSVKFARELLIYDGDISRSLFGEAFKIQAGVLPGGTSTHFIPNYAIAAMCSLDMSGTDSEMRETEKAFSKFVPKSFHLIHNNTLLALIYCLDGSAYSADGDTIIKKLERFAKNYHLYCGVSSKFSDLSQRKSFKLQAAEALKVGILQNPSGYVFDADALYSKVLLSGSVGRVGKQILKLSDVEKLSNFDHENHTNYLYTLEQYLDHGNKLSPAANAMFIDRSTLKYRLQKIKDILNKDFDQPSIAKMLHTGITVFRLCEE